jgi:hypothetical protein
MSESTAIQLAPARPSRSLLAIALWILFAGLIVAAWILLFEACRFNLSTVWTRNYCPRTVDQAGLIAEELHNRELTALLARIRIDLASRIACPTNPPTPRP